MDRFEYINRQWAYGLVDGMPERWRQRLLREWQADRRNLDPAVPPVKQENDANARANMSLRDRIEALKTVRLPLEASDDDVCQVADELAETIAGLSAVFHDAKTLRKAMSGYARHIGIEPPCDDEEDKKYVKDISAIARMTDAQWWRRKLRRRHAKVVEGAAISLGYVNRTSDCYVSRESLMRRIQQNKRNAAMLENTIARNENGDEYTLAELSAKGVANKQIRRAELMTRIAGFEVIARDSNHVGKFITLTCPSRMHKWKTVGKGKVVQNDKYDGTLPDQAQKYLSKKVFDLVRAKWNRKQIEPYGFRIVEPNHDGTPHWHMLLFMPQEVAEEAMQILRDYALRDSPDEAGAQEHRCKVIDIDWSRGSAAGYIAKYVAKNIDGYKVDKDLFGNDAIESSAMVEAWAATWGIRQFQQVGGAPVGVWRELRRVKELPQDAPEKMVRAWTAVNRLEVEDGAQAKRADWAEYVRAMGGVHRPIVEAQVEKRYAKPTVRKVCRIVAGQKVVVRRVVTVRRLADKIVYKRAWALSLAKEDGDGMSRYYEELPQVIVGVQAEKKSEALMPVLEDEVIQDDELERMAEAGMVASVEFRLFKWVKSVVAKSVRYCWEIMRKGVQKYREVGAKKSLLLKQRIDQFIAGKVIDGEALLAQKAAMARLGIV